MRSNEVVKSIFELDFLCFCHFVCFLIVRNVAAKRALQLELQLEVQVRKNMHVHVCAVLHFADSRSHSLFYDRKIYCVISLNNLTFQYFSQNTTHLGLLNQKTELNLEQNCRLWNSFNKAIRIAYSY